MTARVSGAPIGAHVSVAGGLSKAFANAAAVGAETIQIFVANPRGWAPPAADPAGDAAFRDACGEAGMRVFVHAPYLINFGSPSAETLEKSYGALEFSLRRGAAIGAEGVVVHAGSSVLGLDRDGALEQVRSSVLPLLDTLPAGSPRLLIEPTAGGGGALAASASSLGSYLDVLGRDERIGVCLDTCHMHAAGHDFAADPAGTLRAFGRAAGKGNVGLVHVNDSRDPAGSKRDRHEALGRGTIGPAAFEALFSSTVTRRVPLVVETAEADHAADVAFLKKLRG